MKKAARGISEFFGIISYCIRMLWETSRLYFVIRMVLNMISLAVPFAVITFTRMIINVLAGISSGTSTPNMAEQRLLILSAMLLGLNVLSKTVETGRTYYEGLHRDTVDTAMKQRIMKKAAELDLSFFDSAAFYNEVSDAEGNSYLITFSAFQAMDFIRYLVQFAVAFACLFKLSPVLPFAFVMSAVPGMAAELKQVEAIYGFQRQYKGEERKMQYASDILLSREFAKDVRIYNLFPFISGKFLHIWESLFSKKRKISLHYTRLLLLFSALPEIVAAASLFFLGMSVVRGVHTIGDYSFLQGILTQVLSSMYMVIFNYTRLSDGRMRILNYKKFLEFESRICEDGDRKLTAPVFTIEFRNVSFRYSDDLPWVLRNVSFSFESRRKIALAGANGSGKTTIVKLLLRFYDPFEGQILIDGRDIREYDLGSVRRRFSTIFQDYSNYAFNVRESVSLSDLDKMDDGGRVMEALRKSGADGFTSQFPQGLDTYLTRRYDESGQELSGGQWQKMAIARAFYREADIYIMDEPSAALDAQSEDEVFGMFRAMCEGKGALLISHRLSNVHLCDLILVLDGGSLVEMGCHEELMEKGGVYAHMYCLQAEKYKNFL